MQNITFEQLPAAIGNLFEKLESIEKLLQSKHAPFHETEEIFDVGQSAAFLGLSIPTLYTLNSKGMLPSMKRSKKLYFLKQDLIDYLKAGRRQTSSEIASTSHTLMGKVKSKK